MNKFTLVSTSKYFLPQKEYENLYKAISSDVEDNPYTFYTSIYEEGVILSLWSGCEIEDVRKTKEDFPNLSKMIEYCNKNGIEFLRLTNSSFFVFSAEIKNEYGLKDYSHEYKMPLF